MNIFWKALVHTGSNSDYNKIQTNLCKHFRRRNLHYFDVSRDESFQRENEMHSPSFEGFHAYSDCKLTYGNKKQTQLILA